MPKFLIERDMPNVGGLAAEELRDASRNSCDVLGELGPQVQWVESYVTADRITCVYIAPSEELIREHSERSGIPATRIHRIRAIIDPTTAEAAPATP